MTLISAALHLLAMFVEFTTFGPRLLDHTPSAWFNGVQIAVVAFLGLTILMSRGRLQVPAGAGLAGAVVAMFQSYALTMLSMRHETLNPAAGYWIDMFSYVLLAIMGITCIALLSRQPPHSEPRTEANIILGLVAVAAPILQTIALSDVLFSQGYLESESGVRTVAWISILLTATMSLVTLLIWRDERGSGLWAGWGLTGLGGTVLYFAFVRGSGGFQMDDLYLALPIAVSLLTFVAIATSFRQSSIHIPSTMPNILDQQEE